MWESRRGRRWVVSHSISTQEGIHTRIGEVYLGVGDNILPFLEELLEGRTEVGSGRMDGVPVENLDRADFWVARGGDKVLDDMGCDGGCTTYEASEQNRARRGERPAE